VPADPLKHSSVGAATLFRFVLAILGEAPRSEAWSIIDQVIYDASDPAGANGSEPRYPQQPDSSRVR
jgi:hypothetical protein